MTWGKDQTIYFVTQPDFFEKVVRPLRENGYGGMVVECEQRRWWQFWRTKRRNYAKSYWTPGEFKP